MTDLSFAELQERITEDDAEELILSELDAQGFTATSWQSGDPNVTIVKAIAKLEAHYSQLQAFYALNRFNGTATDRDLMAEISQSDFDNTPNEAQTARYTVRFSLVVGMPAETLTANVDSVSTADGSKTFTLKETGTVNAGSYVDIIVEADQAGTAGNVGNGTITNLVTTHAGVTCSNIGIVRQGTDEESIEAMRLRNRQKWATLSVENTNDAIEYLIKTGVSEITSVVIDDSNPRGAGTVDIYCAAALDGASPEAIVAANQIARARYFNADPRIGCIAATTSYATITGTILYDPTIGSSQTQANVESALEDLLSDLPIGGRSYQNGDANVLLRDDVIEALKAATGVVAVSLSGSGNYAVGEFAKLVPPDPWTFTYTATSVS